MRQSSSQDMTAGPSGLFPSRVSSDQAGTTTKLSGDEGG